MPCIAMARSAMPAVGEEENAEKHLEREHQDRVAAPGGSYDYYAMVHTPIPIPKANKIPEAKKALDEEWHKLGYDKKAWIIELE